MIELLRMHVAESVVLQILFFLLILALVLSLVAGMRLTRLYLFKLAKSRHDPIEHAKAKGNVKNIIYFIELIAQISPMLGLLGTVVGMIDVFQVVSQSDGNASPSDMASGIWTALLTTAMGLVVALPSALSAAIFAWLIDDQEQQSREL